MIGKIFFRGADFNRANGDTGQRGMNQVVAMTFAPKIFEAPNFFSQNKKNEQYYDLSHCNDLNVVRFFRPHTST